MATSTRPRASLFECGSCSSLFDDAEHAPLVLNQCGHTICSRCVASASSNDTTSNSSISNEETIIVCPSCEVRTRFRPTEHPPKNRALLDFIASLPISKAEAKTPQKCADCDQPASLCCIDCALIYCSDCWSKLHRRGKLALHQQGPVVDCCIEHPDSILDRCCVDVACGSAAIPICVLCESSPRHRGHVVEMRTGISEDGRVEMQTALDELQSSLEEDVRSLGRLTSVHALQLFVRLGRKAIDTPDNDGWRPIHHAAENGHVKDIETLIRLDNRTLFSPLKKNGSVALHFAAEGGHTSAIEVLVRLGSTDVDIRNTQSWTPLFFAAENGHVSAIETLVRLGSTAIDTPDNGGWTPLCAAAWNGHISVIETLVRLGSNAIDTPDNDGWTPLCAAASNGHVSAIELLVRLGSNSIDSPNNDGCTPLLAAAKNDHLEAMKTLKRLGADPSVPADDLSEEMIEHLFAVVNEDESAEAPPEVSGIFCRVVGVSIVVPA